MKIFRSIKTNWITQKFGKENTYPATLAFYQSLGLDGHNGWDFAVFGCSLGLNSNPQNKCEPVYYDVSCAGEVVQMGLDDKAGLGIVVRTEDKDGIFKHIWWHEHSLDPAIKIGDKLETGDLMGWGGTTGLSTGPHVHRGMKPQGRDTYGNYYKLQPNNGYDGAIDLTPYFENVFVLDKIEAQKKQISFLQQIINLLKILIALRLTIKK